MTTEVSPAFPHANFDGLLAREYAAIVLRVPDSGTPWLDDMIRRANRDELAAPPALQAELDHARRRIGELTIQLGEAMKAPPAALAVPAENVTPMRQPRSDLARLVESIKAAVYANGDGLSVTEAIGALELAKLEILKEQEQ